jgi:hypothetical protein
VLPVGAPLLQSGAGTGEKHPRDGDRGRGAGETKCVGGGDGVALPTGDVPVAIPRQEERRTDRRSVACSAAGARREEGADSEAF